MEPGHEGVPGIAVTRPGPRVEEGSQGVGEVVAQARVELATPAFSVRCSTN